MPPEDHGTLIVVMAVGSKDLTRGGSTDGVDSKSIILSNEGKVEPCDPLLQDG